MPYWEKAMSRIPILKDAVYPTLTNSPDTFTPNGKWILGETPEVNHFKFSNIRIFKCYNAFLNICFLTIEHF